MNTKVSEGFRPWITKNKTSFLTFWFAVYEVWSESELSIKLIPPPNPPGHRGPPKTDTSQSVTHSLVSNRVNSARLPVPLLSQSRPELTVNLLLIVPQLGAVFSRAPLRLGGWRIPVSPGAPAAAIGSRSRQDNGSIHRYLPYSADS